DPDCTFFLSSNAGSTGLNLQAANTVVNVDLPWNPAVLEQRIGRAHRMGQKRPVHVYLLVTTNTLEEGMLDTLGTKSELSRAALDFDSKVATVQLKRSSEDLKARLERILPKAPAPEDKSQAENARREALALTAEQSEIYTRSTGQILMAATSLLVQTQPATHGDPQTSQQIQTALFAGAERNPDGSLSLQVRLPDEKALQNLADNIAALLALGTNARRDPQNC
ncbi:MAG TPA: helicase-related protein, partial [Fibrobacteraceae bacterium]|nr:helicase-related protein [Fibrobacteraceae bacterium]